MEREPTSEPRAERQAERGATVNKPAVWTHRIGKRYGNTWALRDCTIEVAGGSVCALLGPNGAGKTTLLHLLAGLNTPTAGEMRVFGRIPGGGNSYLADIGFLAQDAPLYRRFSVADHFEMGARLNPRYERSRAVDRVAALGIPSTVTLAACREVNDPRWRCRSLSPNDLGFSCSTSRLRPSTRWLAGISSSCSLTLCTRTTSP